MDPEIDFAGLTPRRYWQAGGPDEVISTISRTRSKSLMARARTKSAPTVVVSSTPRSSHNR
jgi:hypothetical protein